MLKRRLSFVALVATIALVAAACGDDTSASSTPPAAVPTPAATTTTAAGETTTTAAPTTTAAGPTALVCQVTDTGGVDDKSFNEGAYNGLLQAAEQLGVATDLLESAAA